MPETSHGYHLRYRITRARWWIRRADVIITPSKRHDRTIDLFGREKMMYTSLPTD